jgi:AraC family transcriptional regulator
MRESAAEAVDLNETARGCGLSRPHFNHLFGNCTGVSSRVYVNTLRVETAVGRLRQHQNEIGSGSEDLGFSAQSNFTRFFQQRERRPINIGASWRSRLTGSPLNA